MTEKLLTGTLSLNTTNQQHQEEYFLKHDHYYGTIEEMCPSQLIVPEQVHLNL